MASSSAAAPTRIRIVARLRPRLANELVEDSVETLADEDGNAYVAVNHPTPRDGATRVKFKYVWALIYLWLLLTCFEIFVMLRTEFDAGRNIPKRRPAYAGYCVQWRCMVFQDVFCMYLTYDLYSLDCHRICLWSYIIWQNTYNARYESGSWSYTSSRSSKK